MVLFVLAELPVGLIHGVTSYNAFTLISPGAAVGSSSSISTIRPEVGQWNELWVEVDNAVGCAAATPGGGGRGETGMCTRWTGAPQAVCWSGSSSGIIDAVIHYSRT